MDGTSLTPKGNSVKCQDVKAQTLVFDKELQYFEWFTTACISGAVYHSSQNRHLSLQKFA